MENCLVTKLKGSVDNDSLHKFGYVDIPVEYTSSVYAYESPVKAYVEGGDGLIDGQKSITVPAYSSKIVTGTSGMVYFERYKNAGIVFNTQQGVNLDGILDVNQFNDFVNSIRFDYINLSQGEFSSYNGELNFQNGHPTGTYMDIAKYTKLKSINTAFTSNNWDWNARSIVKTLPNIECHRTGSLLNYADWDRPSSYPVLCLVGGGSNPDSINSTAADAYLINMAQCQKGTKYFNIYITSRTAASDAAVDTLTNMGYTISVKDGVVSV